jgi:hypothetical protein
MILKLLKSKRPINLLIFPGIALLFWLKDLLHPFSYSFSPGENNTVLCGFFNEITDGLDFVRVLISLVFVVFIGVAIQVVNDRFSFIYIRTKLPASLFVIIVSGFTQLHTLFPVFPATLFLLFALFNLFGTFEKPKPYDNIFNTGLFLGIGTLFYLNLLILLPAFIIGIVILSHESNWRYYAILLIGYVLPAIFTLSYAFISDRVPELFLSVTTGFSNPANYFHTNIPLYVFFSFLILLTLTGSIKIMQQYDSKKVSTRKYFTIFLIIFILSLISFILFPGTSQEMLIIAAVPVTYLISNLFVFMKSKFWSEFLFLLLIGIVIFMQIAEKIF